MLTTSTLEIRWFEYGSIPVSVKEWFSNNCPGRLLGELPEIREDLYLLLPECETLSLKLRQGNLELKLRQANLGIKSFGAVGNQVGWKGQAEKWLKWSYEKEEIAPLRIMNQEIEDSKSWLKVKKRRSQRLYRGSCCELTQLEVNNHFWWSIAFEMLEEETIEQDSLETFVNLVSQTYPELELSEDKSYGYPRWLVGQ